MERTPTLIFYSILFLITLATISITLIKHPLFPLDSSNLDWSNAWLLATVIDYYGACLCLCGVIIASEPSLLGGILWVTGCCLLGSPVCCAWILYRTWTFGGVRLARPHH